MNYHNNNCGSYSEFGTMNNQEQAYLKQLGRKIATVRKEKKMTQADLCAIINMDIPNLSAIENGRQNPTALMLRKIGEALEVNPKLFLDFGGAVISREPNE